MINVIAGTICVIVGLIMVERKRWLMAGILGVCTLANLACIIW